MLLIAFILMYCLGDGILKKIGKFGLMAYGIFFAVVVAMCLFVLALYILGFRPS